MNKDDIDFVSIRCPRSLKDWLAREAEKNFRSRNSQVLTILEAARQAQIAHDQAKVERA